MTDDECSTPAVDLNRAGMVDCLSMSTQTNAEAVLDPLRELIEGAGQEVREAAESWLDLAEETAADAREQKAEYRETWESGIEEVESHAIDLVAAFGYVAIPRKKAKEAGLA